MFCAVRCKIRMPARPLITIPTRRFRRERKLLNHDDTRIFGRGGYGQCGECTPVIDSLGINRLASRDLCRRIFAGGDGGVRLGHRVSTAATPMAFASSSFKIRGAPSTTGGPSAASNAGGSRRPATHSHRTTASVPGLIPAVALILPAGRQTGGRLTANGGTRRTKPGQIS